MTTLHHFTPDQREAIAKVESLRAMREAKHHWRAHYRSMPAASVEASPCVEAGAAGAQLEIAA